MEIILLGSMTCLLYLPVISLTSCTVSVSVSENRNRVLNGCHSRGSSITEDSYDTGAYVDMDLRKHNRRHHHGKLHQFFLLWSLVFELVGNGFISFIRPTVVICFLDINLEKPQFYECLVLPTED